MCNEFSIYLGQDWEKNANSSSDADKPKKVKVAMNNIAGQDAEVKLEGNDKDFPIPKDGKATITITTSNDTSTFSAKDKEGNNLMVNGKEKIEISNDDAAPISLVVHKKGILSKLLLSANYHSTSINF